MTFSSKFYVAALLMMIFGTGTMICAKLMLQTESVNRDGELRHFDKPWFQSTAMFVSMLLCMLLFYGNQSRHIRHAKKPEEVPPEYRPSKRTYLLISVPAFFDLLATTLMTFGLIFLPVSTMQLLRGSMVVFSAILNVTLLKRKLLPYKWLGVALVTAAMGLVGIATIMSSDESSDSIRSTIIGVSLVIGSQAIQALQIVIEDLLLSNIAVSPTFIVGMEGFWGALMCFTFFLPAAQLFKGYSFGEDSIDTVIMLKNNMHLVLIACAYCVSILLLNYAGMTVTAESTSVVRTILEAMRTVFIWLVGLLIHYFISKDFGEKWSNWSYLQLFAFFLLFFAMCVYNGIVKLPGLRYEDVGFKGDEVVNEEVPLLVTETLV
ncbi:hypothetical protein RCL1_001646 [Eukaryota sp. TZLM3-RCL]